MKSIFHILLVALSLSLVLNCKPNSSKENPKKDQAHTESKHEGAKKTKSVHKAHWGYSGEEGPENWGHLDEKFLLCEKGKNQSPIDINKTPEVVDLPELVFNYAPTKLSIVNNGHTIQVNYAPGSKLIIGDKTFDLLQFHFHSPSEHKVQGKPYGLEMHLVHKNKMGQLAVVGVLFKKGSENPFIKKIWEHMPEKINEIKNIDLEINALDGIPKNQSYFHYTGSLTTPPCSEGVNWNVMKAELEVSEGQIEKFFNLIKANARPVQPINDRTVQLEVAE